MQKSFSLLAALTLVGSMAFAAEPKIAVMAYVTSGPAEAQKIIEDVDTTVVGLLEGGKSQADGIRYEMGKTDEGYGLRLVIGEMQIQTTIPNESMAKCSGRSMFSVQTPVTFKGSPSIEDSLKGKDMQLPAGEYQLSEIWVSCVQGAEPQVPVGR